MPPLYNAIFRGKLKSMDEQKVIRSFTIVCKHLSKIDDEIQKETKDLMGKLDELKNCFDSLFRQNVN